MQPTSTIVDVDKLFIDYIEECKKRKRALTGPNILNLKEFELNLRKYRIVGGIYSLEYVEQPEQNVKLSSNAYLRTSKLQLSHAILIVSVTNAVFQFSQNFKSLSVIGPNTLKRRQFFQYYRPPAPTPAGVRRLPEEVETELKAIEKGLSKLAYITIV